MTRAGLSVVLKLCSAIVLQIETDAKIRSGVRHKATTCDKNDLWHVWIEDLRHWFGRVSGSELVTDASILDLGQALLHKSAAKMN